MKKILISLLVVIVSTIMSCKKLEDLNTNTKAAEKVPSETLFANAMKNLVDQETSASVNFNVFRAFSQYWTETTYTDESRYDVLNRKIPDTEFTTLYRDILADFKEAERIAAEESDVVSTAAQKKNKKAIAEILTVYTFQRAVDIFGNVPYEKALDIKNLSPGYDDAQTIYSKLFARLDAAIADLNTAESSWGASDMIYGGDAAKWKKFANSLKLKMAITVADVASLNPGTVATNALNAGVFTSAADGARFDYLSTSPNTNPVYVDLVASGRYDWVVTNTIVDTMNALNDPRRAYFFDSNLAGGVYKGGVYGASNAYPNFTHVSPTVTEATREAYLISYTEVQFYLAEAAARGFIAGTPDTYYNAGITSSILYWGGTAAEAAAYLAQPSVAYATAVSPTASYKRKIGIQSWLASYDRGLIGWTTWRRLDAPKFNPPSGMTNADIPTRFTYPIGEQTKNGASYTAAASAIGGDKLTTKLFWDKY